MSFRLSETISPYATRWNEVVARRRSRRQYDPAKPLTEELLARLRSFCAAFRPFAGARAELLEGDAERVFWSVLGGYGKIKGVHTAIAFIGDTKHSEYQAEVGYTGECIILEATAMGLGTCWVGGFFRPGLVKKLLRLGKNERVLAVTPVGFAPAAPSVEEAVMSGIAWRDHREPLEKLLVRNSLDSAEWVRIALEAARLAPSAMNRQPWGFEVAPGSITVSVRTGGPEMTISKRLDCGIAMLHIEVAAMSRGVRGSWEWLKPPGVARFSVA